MIMSRTPIEIPWKTGKVAVLADLHHDSYNKIRREPFESHGLDRSLQWAELDALIIAGDLANAPFTNWSAAFAYLRRFIDPSRTIIFPGNHDYYAACLCADDELEKLAKAAGVQFAQQREVRHGDDRYFCTTLWTDFAMLNDPEAAMNVARQHMNDYSQIFKRLEAGPLSPSELLGRPQQVAITPEDILALHNTQRSWLEDRLAEPHWVPNGRSFVVTHHGPHPDAAGQIDDLTPAFHSDLTPLFDQHWIDGWYFGHSHRRLAAQVGSTPVRNVSVGFPLEKHGPEELPLEELCLVPLPGASG
ncbi:metallophosphoesterase [Leisingera sp. M658]|uniref:metallophosphoesterase family protein n=1 Tax=Leisingera sp. M658 TaxID=2867015 RepID=UPI0021A96E5C|nr:metallophosphoesterase [Leisingera sp. M658]UWQ75810.1 metallophosphoesterase [Leisingera sp. M658]